VGFAWIEGYGRQVRIPILIGLLIIHTLFRFFRRSITYYIKETESRYRARKFITYIGYIVAVIFLSVVLSDRLGGLTVTFGLAGAGKYCGG
jgi:small-conductance mechanosensitive channel